MRDRISVLFIDPHKDEHDYENLTLENNYKYFISWGEKTFDVHVLTSTDKILTEINRFKGFDCLITIGPEKDIDFAPLNALSFEYRKKWIHCDTFNKFEIANSIINVFLYNINRERPRPVKLFSIFTCTFNTPAAVFDRLYNSLKAQTYNNWNWYILDDSTDPSVARRIEHLHDPRIVLIKNVTNHGVIGFNKHLIAMACDGDYLVEVDHDDELTKDCLYYLNKAFETYPDTTFVYSHAMEELDGKPVDYGNNFALGLGEYRDMEINGVVVPHIALTADVNALSVRAIYALPNHVRCWDAKFYRQIGGHNIDLSVLDDMDILIRTFLYGKMTKVDKVLYIQHEGTTKTSGRGDTTQRVRFKEIQRTNHLLHIKYDKQIHDKILEYGAEDPFWINEEIVSDTRLQHEELPIFNHILKVS